MNNGKTLLILGLIGQAVQVIAQFLYPLAYAYLRLEEGLGVYYLAFALGAAFAFIDCGYSHAGAIRIQVSKISEGMLSYLSVVKGAHLFVLYNIVISNLVIFGIGFLLVLFSGYEAASVFMFSALIHCYSNSVVLLGGVYRSTGNHYINVLCIVALRVVGILPVVFLLLGTSVVLAFTWGYLVLHALVLVLLCATIDMRLLCCRRVYGVSLRSERTHALGNVNIMVNDYLMCQLPRMVVGVFGDVFQVVLFSMHLALSRQLLSVLRLVRTSLISDFTKKVADGCFSAYVSKIQRNLVVVTITMSSMALCLSAPFFQIWSMGAVDVDLPLLLLLLVSSVMLVSSGAYLLVLQVAGKHYTPCFLANIFTLLVLGLSCFSSSSLGLALGLLVASIFQCIVAFSNYKKFSVPSDVRVEF